MSSTVVTASEIRPFHVDVPQEELDADDAHTCPLFFTG
jgi:hypothetical protein